MKLTKNRVWAILIFIIGTLIITILYYLLEDKDKTIVNGFTMFGTYFSLYGLAIAYLQIHSISQTSKQTKIAVERSLLRITQVLSVSDLSRANKTIQEIQSFIIQEKHEIALMRMRDLKGILIQLKYNEELAEYTNDSIYNRNVTDLGADINNLHDLIVGTKKGLNFSRLNQNLESIATTLNEFENKLKYKGYDT